MAPYSPTARKLVGGSSTATSAAGAYPSLRKARPEEKKKSAWDALTGPAMMGLKALATLDLPRSFVASSAKEIADVFVPGDRHDASFSEWWEQAMRHKGAGDYLKDYLPGGTGSRWGDIAVGFVGDVLTDPLTYVGGPGAKALAAGGRKAVAQSVSSDITRQGLRLGVARGGEGSKEAAELLAHLDSIDQQILKAPGDTELAKKLMGQREQITVNRPIPGAPGIGRADRLVAERGWHVPVGDAVQSLMSSDKGIGALNHEMTELLIGPNTSGLRVRPFWKTSGGPQILSQERWGALTAPIRSLRGDVAKSRFGTWVRDKTRSEVSARLARMIADGADTSLPAWRRIQLANRISNDEALVGSRTYDIRTGLEAALHQVGEDSASLERIRRLVEAPATPDASELAALGKARGLGDQEIDAAVSIRAEFGKLRTLFEELDAPLDDDAWAEVFFPMMRKRAKDDVQFILDYERGIQPRYLGTEVQSVRQAVDQGIARIEEGELVWVDRTKFDVGTWRKEVNDLEKLEFGDDWEQRFLNDPTLLVREYVNRKASQLRRHVAERAVLDQGMGMRVADWEMAAAADELVSRYEAVGGHMKGLELVAQRFAAVTERINELTQDFSGGAGPKRVIETELATAHMERGELIQAMADLGKGLETGNAKVAGLTTEQASEAGEELGRLVSSLRQTDTALMRKDPLRLSVAKSAGKELLASEEMVLKRMKRKLAEDYEQTDYFLKVEDLKGKVSTATSRAMAGEVAFDEPVLRDLHGLSLKLEETGRTVQQITQGALRHKSKTGLPMPVWENVAADFAASRASWAAHVDAFQAASETFTPEQLTRWGKGIEVVEDTMLTTRDSLNRMLSDNPVPSTGPEQAELYSALAALPADEQAAITGLREKLQGTARDVQRLRAAQKKPQRSKNYRQAIKRHQKAVAEWEKGIALAPPRVRKMLEDSTLSRESLEQVVGDYDALARAGAVVDAEPAPVVTATPAATPAAPAAAPPTPVKLPRVEKIEKARGQVASEGELLLKSYERLVAKPQVSDEVRGAVEALEAVRARLISEGKDPVKDWPQIHRASFAGHVDPVTGKAIFDSRYDRLQEALAVDAPLNKSLSIAVKRLGFKVAEGEKVPTSMRGELTEMLHRMTYSETIPRQQLGYRPLTEEQYKLQLLADHLTGEGRMSYEKMMRKAKELAEKPQEVLPGSDLEVWRKEFQGKILGYRKAAKALQEAYGVQGLKFQRRAPKRADASFAVLEAGTEAGLKSVRKAIADTTQMFEVKAFQPTPAATRTAPAPAAPAKAAAETGELADLREMHEEIGLALSASRRVSADDYPEFIRLRKKEDNLSPKDMERLEELREGFELPPSVLRGLRPDDPLLTAPGGKTGVQVLAANRKHLQQLRRGMTRGMKELEEKAARAGEAVSGLSDGQQRTLGTLREQAAEIRDSLKRIKEVDPGEYARYVELMKKPGSMTHAERVQFAELKETFDLPEFMKSEMAFDDMTSPTGVARRRAEAELPEGESIPKGVAAADKTGADVIRENLQLLVKKGKGIKASISRLARLEKGGPRTVAEARGGARAPAPTKAAPAAPAPAAVPTAGAGALEAASRFHRQLQHGRPGGVMNQVNLEAGIALVSLGEKGVVKHFRGKATAFDAAGNPAESGTYLVPLAPPKQIPHQLGHQMPLEEIAEIGGALGEKTYLVTEVAQGTDGPVFQYTPAQGVEGAEDAVRLGRAQQSKRVWVEGAAQGDGDFFTAAERLLPDSSEFTNVQGAATAQLARYKKHVEDDFVRKAKVKQQQARKSLQDRQVEAAKANREVWKWGNQARKAWRKADDEVGAAAVSTRYAPDFAQRAKLEPLAEQRLGRVGRPSQKDSDLVYEVSILSEAQSLYARADNLARDVPGLDELTQVKIRGGLTALANSYVKEADLTRILPRAKELNAAHRQSLAAQGRTKELIEKTEKEMTMMFERMSQALDQKAYRSLVEGEAGMHFRTYGGVYTTEEVHDVLKAISKYEELPKQLAKMERMVRVWRGFAIMSPGFLVRNWYAGVYSNLTSGVSIGLQNRVGAEYLRYARKLPAKDKEVRSFIEHAQSQGGIMNQGAAHLDLPTAPTARSLLPTAGALGGRKIFFGHDWVRRGGSHVENALRLASAYHGFTTTGGDLNTRYLAGRLKSNKYHFDYADLSGLERRAKIAVPFYTWMARNAVLQAEQFAARPQLALNMERAFRAAGHGAAQNPYIPDYFDRNNYYQFSQNWFMTPELPYVASVRDMNRLKGEPIEMLTELNPVLRATQEAIYKRDLFRGYELEGSERWLRVFDDLFPFVERGARVFGVGDRKHSRLNTVLSTALGIPLRQLNERDMVRTLKQRKREAPTKVMQEHELELENRAVAREEALTLEMQQGLAEARAAA